MSHFTKFTSFVFLFLLIMTDSIAQNEWNNWVFSNNHIADFSTGSFFTSSGGSITSVRGNASISDASGNLLFYTNGETIWNSQHAVMPNGSGLNGCDQSSQSSIIVKRRDLPNKYLVFTIDCRENGYANGLQYSEVDMSLNGGLGGVTNIKNVPLQTQVAELITAALDPSGNTWVIVHSSTGNTWYAYLVDCNGVSGPITSNAGWNFTPASNNEEGQFKSSPSGNLIAYTYAILGFSTGQGIAELLDFNQSTGIVSNAIFLPTFGVDSYGCEFSSNGQVLYVSYFFSPTYTSCSPSSGHGIIDQYDISNTATIPPPISLELTCTPNQDNVGQLQRGPNGQIYSNLIGGMTYLFGTAFGNYYSIEFPNVLGAGCNLTDQNPTNVTSPIMWGYPNFAPVSPVLYCGLQVSLENDTICEGECIDLVASTTGNNTGLVTYQWSNGIIDTDSIANVCPISTTTYEVVATDSLGETDTANVTITVLSSVIADLGNDTIICSPPYVLNAGNPGSTYQWNDGSTGQSLLVDTTGTYWVVVNNGGCTDSVGVNITVIDLLVNLGQDTTLCDSVNIQLDAGNAGANYLWNDSSTGQTLNVTVAGTYWVAVTYGSCTNSDTVEVNVLPVPSVNLGNDTVLCIGDFITLDAQNTGASYVWQDSSVNQTFTASSAGTFWVEASVGNCSDVDSVSIILDSVVVDLGPAIITCIPDTIELNADNFGLTYLWNNGSTNQTLNVVTVGNYNVLVTNSIGCQGVDSVQVVLGTLSIDLGNDTVICEGQNLVLNAGVNGSSYLWSDNSTNQTLSVNQSGTYWLEVESGLCSDADSIEILVQQIEALFDIPDAVGCSPLIVEFVDQSTINFGQITGWQWNFNNGTSYLQNPEQIYQNEVNTSYNVQLIVTSSIGCTDDTLQTIFVNAYPSASAGLNNRPSEPLLGEPINFENLSTNSSSWEWSFGDGTISNEENPSHVYEEAGTYAVTLIAINADGCNDTITYQLIVSSEIVLFAPNAFTPDGDKFNNMWQYYISGISNENFSAQIFNRWGELIWESNIPNEPWDGFYKSGAAQDNVYTWKIECESEKNAEHKTFIGHLSIVR